MRKKIIAGNWKMNMLPNEAMKFIEDLAPLVKETENEVILCVPYTDLFYALLTVQGTNIKIGAQNMHFEEKGAYTGEVSGKMLKSINVEYVIIGHPARRQYFNETDETVNKNSIKEIRNKIAEIYGQEVANGVIIQYGGSVKSTNAKELFSMSDIDGGLVGGASLKAEEFSKIVNYNK